MKHIGRFLAVLCIDDDEHFIVVSFKPYSKTSHVVPPSLEKILFTPAPGCDTMLLENLLKIPPGNFIILDFFINVNNFFRFFYNFFQGGDFMDYSAFVKQLCKENGTTAYKLERDLGFGNGYVASLKDRISSKRALLIAEYFNIPVELFYGQEKKPATETDLMIDKILTKASTLSESELQELLSFAEYIQSKHQGT